MAKPVQRKEGKLGVATPKPPAAQIPGPPTPTHEPEVTATQLNDEDLDVSAIKSRIEDLVSAVGTEVFPDTMVPRPKNRNNGEAASRFVTADIVYRAAEKLLKAAKEQAENEGVFGDPDSYKDGETKMVYNTPYYTINMKVGNPSLAINKDKTEEVLGELLPKDKAVEAMKRCMKPRSPAQQVIISIK